MKRDIKFRAWCGKYKMMVDPFGLIDYMEVFETGRDSDGLEYNIMQYTGLKDKNGVEIYEGDILKYSQASKWTHIVEWGYQEAGEPADGNHAIFAGWDVPLNEDRKVELEIIGNMYQNPELIINQS